ncbi:hypothetical protein M407DRAFT_25078 [Tulasnella calospora MUT 4182]|uniref:Xylanolytic transcriptional activator regulatory domain-containing protein n=1 Tax=Tulasnella calospora MUT 4182 TaxID=1051891 RepID=A0A0C3KVS8_9AGAM|nr:hypothetical protein M407DRAFT_25078 [Tulasnella calospora MUT 4182]
MASPSVQFPPLISSFRRSSHILVRVCQSGCNNESDVDEPQHQLLSDFPWQCGYGLDGELAAAGVGMYDAAGYLTEGFEVVRGGWNPDLPEPRLLNHLVTLYFSRDTCASRILHRPTFLLAMSLPPTHPDFPHPALLHAICASASRRTTATKSTRLTAKGERDRTRTYIDQTIATGQNIFSVLLASIVLSWWFYSEGRWVEVWSHAGFLTRVSIPLGLNFPGTHRSHNASPYLAPPRNPTDLEERRRAWWMCIMFDRIVSVGGWPHSIDGRDVGTEPPLQRVDFEAETGVPSNPQDLTAEGLFTRHNPLYTDPYLLFLKACLLFGRVTDYNTRMVNLRNAPRSEPTFSSSSASLQHPPNPSTSSATDFKGDPRMAAGFLQQSGMGLEDVNGTALDTDLYMAHIVLHAATITLHNPYMDFGDHTVLRQILRYQTTASLCNDLLNEAAVWGEINQLRQAMIDFGTVSPIGVRQEKLLQGLMTDITRLTSQAQPLNVRVLLYPFSRKSLYDPTFQPTIADVVDASNKSTHNPGASSIERLLNRNSAPQPNQSHVPSHAAPLPAPTTYTDDTAALSMGTIGVGMELSGLSGLGVLGGAFDSTTMISAQGIWRPDGGFGMMDPNGSSDPSGAATDIYEQLGFEHSEIRTDYGLGFVALELSVSFTSFL